MTDPTVLPAMDEAQAASWHAMMELYKTVPENWALVGGQLVHLHCAERGSYPTRPTTDPDAVVNIRADPQMLTRFTATLVDLGFTADTSGEGHQHRWRRDLAQVDVLIPGGRRRTRRVPPRHRRRPDHLLTRDHTSVGSNRSCERRHGKPAIVCDSYPFRE